MLQFDWTTVTNHPHARLCGERLFLFGKSVQSNLRIAPERAPQLASLFLNADGLLPALRRGYRICGRKQSAS